MTHQPLIVITDVKPRNDDKKLDVLRCGFVESKYSINTWDSHLKDKFVQLKKLIGRSEFFCIAAPPQT